MAKTYKPHHYSPHTYPHLSPHDYHHRPSWAETQAGLLLSLRDVSTPPTKTPDADVRRLDADRQIHARWTDPDLVVALSRLQKSLPRTAKLSFRYGGRDVTASTWVLVYLTFPRGLPELRHVLWFHEYDDLDVEVGDLAGVEWGVDVKSEEREKVKVEEDVDVKREVIVKVELEDVDLHG